MNFARGPIAIIGGQVKDLKSLLTQALIDTDTASGARQVIDGEPPVAFLAAFAGESS